MPFSSKHKVSPITKRDTFPEYCASLLGNDERLFWQRAEDRNRATADLYKNLGLAFYEDIEAFVEYKII
jgi:glucosamine-6-phosphate deaminase